MNQAGSENGLWIKIQHLNISAQLFVTAFDFDVHTQGAKRCKCYFEKKKKQQVIKYLVLREKTMTSLFCIAVIFKTLGNFPFAVYFLLMKY